MNVITPLVQDRKRKVAAAGGIISAMLASSCCVGPLVLITLGASGTWIGSLTALKAYQPVFVAASFVFLGFGFWQIYGTTAQTCAEDSYCANRTSSRIVKSALWIATGLVIIALTVDLWAPLFY